MATPQAPLHGSLERMAHARGSKTRSGTRTCAQQGPAGDGEQRPLVPRSRCSPRLKRSVRHLWPYSISTTQGEGCMSPHTPAVRAQPRGDTRLLDDIVYGLDGYG